MILADASTRSMGSSSSSSVCTDDPAMRRAIRKTEGLRPKAMEVPHAKRQRTVRFCSELTSVVCEVQNREEWTAEEKSELFLTPEDMQRVRNDAKFIAKYFRFKDIKATDQLDTAYGIAVARSTANEETDSFFSFLQNSENELDDHVAPLRQWCSKNKVTGRGLERYCSKKQRAERPQVAKECREAVLRLSTSADVSSQDLANFYHDYSRSTTIYARFMGCADEIAAKAAVQTKEKQSLRPVKASLKDQETLWSTALADSPPRVLKATTQESSVQADRRQKLLIASKQQSSSTRLLVERLGKATISKRLDL